MMVIRLIWKVVVAFQESFRSLKLESTRVEWPLVLLRGNGNLYIMLIGIDTEK